MQTVNLDAGSYLRKTSSEVLATAEKEKKEKYLQTYLECRRSFNTIVYSMDRIPGTDAVPAQRHLASLFCNETNQGYLEMCSFVRDRMSLAIVISNTLLRCGAMDKEV